jgi:hypothetical protein
MFTFDEAISSEALSTNTFYLTNNAALAVPYRVCPDAAGRVVRVEPLVLPLRPGVTYSNVVSSALADAASNRWVSLEGAAVPAEGAVFAFTTAAILEVLPASNTMIIAGQAVPITVNFESGLGASFFRFVLNDAPPIDVAVSPNANTVSARLELATNATKYLAQRRVIDNAGTVAWSGGGVQVSSGIAAFNNLSGALFEIQGDSAFAFLLVLALCESRPVCS